MKNSVRIKNMAGYLNFICDKDIPFEKIISDLRERLEIIEQKKNKYDLKEQALCWEKCCTVPVLFSF
jgi:hypothetical protein